MDNVFPAVAAVVIGYLVVSRVLSARARISGAQARSLVTDGAQLVDVRTPSEFASGHIGGAINVPLGDLSRRLGELQKEKPLVVYCASGMRSARATRLLGRAGFAAHDLGPQRAWPD